MELIKFIPINTGEKFIDNTINVTITKNNKQLPVTFTASSSSFFSDAYKPFQAFNGSSDDKIFWQTNTYPNPNNPKPTITRPKVPNPYTQPPYVVYDGSYQGGGRNNGYYFSTNINSETGNNSISNGEWIQIQLPSPILLSLYSVLAPSQQGDLNFFPQKFTLAGSQDGIKWNYINYQDINNNDYSCKDRKPISFTVSNTTPYSYFRLIINKLPNNNTIVKINQFNLSGIYPVESFTGNRIADKPINPQFYGPYPSLNTFSSNFSNFFISEPMTGRGNHSSSSRNGARESGVYGLRSEASGDNYRGYNYYPLLTEGAILETVVYDPPYEDDKIFIGSIIIILTGTIIYTLFTGK